MDKKKSNSLVIARKYFDLYYFLSKQDIKNRFRRSYLGIGWLVVQQLMFALFASIVWARVFGIDANNFIPFLVIGIAIWGFITASMVESCSIFIQTRAYLRQFPLPHSVFIFRYLLTNVYYLAIGMITALFVFIIFNKFNLLGIFYSIPGILILLVYFYAASGTMAYLGLRYRDFQHALTGIFSLLFIVTPVIFPPEILIKKGISMVIYLNPFASLIDIVRHPIINGEFAPIQQYATAIVFTSILLIVQYVLEKKWGRLVPFWA
ncbi:MAG: hypothetical protein EKK61_04505 [Rickettsiales bacterium]|nr:MAG: hypothetical protein EKK61_04505 [Rickettsiales bacterium]